jgi:hypothetical protein
VTTNADFKASPVCIAGTTCLGVGVTFTGVLAAQEAFHSNHKNDAASDATKKLGENDAASDATKNPGAPSEPSLGASLSTTAALADCKPIPNSSMELNGAGWSGTVIGGDYHCKLAKSTRLIYDYKVDCTKSGGENTRFYFNDGGDEYSLSMSSNGHHTVSYNGNPRIVSIRTFSASSNRLYPHSWVCDTS